MLAVRAGKESEKTRALDNPTVDRMRWSLFSPRSNETRDMHAGTRSSMDQLASDLQQGVIAAPAAAAHVRRTNPVELGTIQYVNLNGKHGDMQAALSAAKASGKPIFANFAEFPG